MAKPLVGSGKRPARPKQTLEVSDGVRVVMAGLNQAEKTTVESAFASATSLLNLPVEFVVRAPSGDMCTARVTEDLRLVYRVEPKVSRVTDLLSAGAVRYLLHPGWTVQSKPAAGKRVQATGAKLRNKALKNVPNGS